MLEPARSRPRKPLPRPASDAVVTAIEEEARAVALAFGWPSPGAAAAALVDRLLMRFGGEQPYLPRRRPGDTAARDATIRARFTGDNTAALAREFDLSPRRVRQIVAPRK